MTPEANMPQAIAEAVAAIMAKVKNVEKHGENKFHNYKFAKVEDLLFQVQPALAEAGLVITQDEVSHEVLSDALMLSTYAFSLSHKSGVTWGPVHHTGMASLRNTKGGFDDKALNKCHTAARKYFILGLFQIPAGDLPDADTEEDKPAPEQSKLTAAQLAEVEDLIERSGAAPSAVLQAYGVKALADVPQASFAKLTAQLNARIAKQQKEAA